MLLFILTSLMIFMREIKARAFKNRFKKTSTAVTLGHLILASKALAASYVAYHKITLDRTEHTGCERSNDICG